jgi:hypothetical protein
MEVNTGKQETTTTDSVVETPVVETTEGGFVELSDDDVRQMLSGKPIPPKEPEVPETKAPEVAAATTTTTTQTEEDFIKIPKSQLSGMFDGDLDADKIVNRLKTPVQNTGIDENTIKAAEKGKVLLERPDIAALVNHALKPNSDIRHYVDLMSTDISKLSDFDAIAQLGILEGKDGAKYRSMLKSQYMQFGDEEYAEYGPERLQSLKDAAAIQLEEDGKAAREKIAKMQSDAKRPDYQVEESNQKQIYLQTKDASTKAWEMNLNKVLEGNKITQNLKFKDTDGADLELPFTYDLTKPERVAELQKYVNEYISTVLTYTPGYVPNETTIAEAKAAATNRYLVSHFPEILTQIAEDINAEADLRYAKKINQPVQSQVVTTDNREAPKAGLQPVTEQEVREILNR